MYIPERPSFKEPFKTQRLIGSIVGGGATTAATIARGGGGGGRGSRNFDI